MASYFSNEQGERLNALQYTQVWSCFKENTLQIIAEVKKLQKMTI